LQFKAVVFFGIVAFLICIPTARRYVQWSPATHKPGSKTFKVTSYNSMLFDLYNWKKNRTNRQMILNAINEISPDILCVQEFYTSEDLNDFNNLDTVSRILNCKYIHHEYTTTLRGNVHWGMATFSKYPIINQGKIVFQTRSNNLCIFSDIVIGKDTVRVYNVHLQSISFSKEDNAFWEDVITEKEATDEMAKGKNILRRLKRAFLKRSQQADMIALHMQTCPYPMILCGDFNDTAASYVYERLSKHLHDAFVQKGNGFGRTYAGNWPQFRIDYILHDKDLTCVDYVRDSETFTDHYPISASFMPRVLKN